EGVGVVDDRGEDVGGRARRLALAEQHHRGVVAVLEADRQPGLGRRGQQAGPRLLKLSRWDLARTAPTTRILSQPDVGRHGSTVDNPEGTMTAQILQRRAEIERAMAGQTICDLLDRTAAAAGGAPAFSDEAGDGWQTLTWAQARPRIRELAAGVAPLGPGPRARVAPPRPDRSPP